MPHPASTAMPLRTYAEGLAHGLTAPSRGVPPTVLPLSREKAAAWNPERGYWLGYVRGYRKAVS